MRNALGHLTLIYRDGLGRDTLVVTPTDAASAGDSTTLRNSRGVRQRTTYDVMDRVRVTETIGPATQHAASLDGEYQPNPSPLERLVVQTEYDPEGWVFAVGRGIEPDPANLGVQLTTYEYDNAGRKKREVANQVEQRFEYDRAGNQTAWVTGRGLRVTSQYDALGRVTRRISPAVEYEKITCYESGCIGPVYPLYPNTGNGGYRIPEEWTHYRYDAAGQLVHAENGDGQVRRTYYPGGALATDSLRLRTGSGPEFTDTYGLAYGYDIAGRVTGLQHPTNLAFGSAVDGFEYHPVTGSVSRAWDRLNNSFTFRYDRLDRLTSILVPGGVVDSMRYDLAGRLVGRLATTPASTAPLQDEQMAYDGRSKLVHVHANATLYRAQSVYTQWYSGLGNLVATDWDNVGGPEWQREDYQVDPLGNMVYKRTIVPGPETQQNDYPEYRYMIDPARGAVGSVTKLPPPGMDETTAARDDSFRSYDGSGNQNYTREYVEQPYQGSSKYVSRTSESRSYYDADERLRAVQEYENNYKEDGSFGSTSGIWEEYRYDPLGRRIMVTTRREAPLCDVDATTCINGTTRFVWAGDQVLWELKQADGAYSADAGGQVSYFHAGGIDRPLTIWKAGVGTVVPHQNWRGQFARGTFTNGAPSDCQTYPPQGCVPIRWPGWSTTAWHDGAGKQPVTGYEHYWFGSLSVGMRDASGLMYMRNRYYDPKTGQFTQTDPIGLAGGLNAYGFAAGDPVSFSDPYGLTVNDVFVMCRPLGGEGGEGVAGHCAIRVIDKEREIDVTVELLPMDGRNALFASGPESELASAYVEPSAANKVDVPRGMTSQQFDDAVLNAAAVEGYKVAGDRYLPFGDVNSNRYVYNVIRAAGGQVPRSASAQFIFVPGICGGKMLSRGKNCRQ